MKRTILFFALFVCFFNAYGAGNESVLYTKTLGSCSTHDLSFRALRFTRIPIKSEGENVFLRLIFFIKEEGIVTTRLTLQELLGCQMTKDGEVCSYRPLKNNWVKGLWSFVDEDISIEAIGRIKTDKNTFKISIDIASDFPYKELQGLSFPGSMVKVNFNEDGLNTEKICQENP